MHIVHGRTLLACIASTVFYGILCLVQIRTGVLEISNPDYIAYLRISEYFDAGRFDLAINGYWSPAYPALISALAPFWEDRWHAGVFAMLLSGAAFVLAFHGLATVCRIKPVVQFFGGLIMGAFAHSIAARAATPDLLFSATLLCAVTCTTLAYNRGSVRMAVVAGVVFGLSYMVKTPGIVIAGGIAIMMGLMASMGWLGGNARRPFAVTLCLVLSVAITAAPWIATLSVQNGSFTWTTAAERNQQINLRQGNHPNFEAFHLPSPGRITSWEDPVEIDNAVASPRLEEVQAELEGGKVTQRIKLIVMNFLVLINILGPVEIEDSQIR